MRDSLAAIAGVATCKIRLEANISPSDYRLIRVVPSNVADGEFLGQRRAEVLIYFGTSTLQAESGDLEAVYEALFGLETLIRDKLWEIGCQAKETICDEDRLGTCKVLATGLGFSVCRIGHAGK